MKFESLAVATLTLAAIAMNGEAAAQSLKDRLVGTWTHVISEVVAADGTKALPFGPRPQGVMMFTADGHFTQIHIAAEVPKIANNNRLQATAEENAAIVRGSVAQFGTWTVDEEKQHLILEITSSTFANWRGIKQTRLIVKLTDDEFVNSNPDVGAGRGAGTNWFKRGK